MQKIFLILFILYPFSLPAMEKLQSLEWKKFLEKYDTSDKNCRFTINRHFPFILPEGIHRFTQLACLIAGKKKVYIEDDFSFLDNVKKDSFLQNLITREKIEEIFINYHDMNKEKNIIFYRPEGKHFAFLLALYHLERANNYNQLNFNAPLPNFNLFSDLTNWYLYGLLLDYPKDDIQFFYALDAFEKKEGTNLGAINFHNWPEESKSKFFTFEKEIWPFSTEYKKYLNDVKKAMEWLVKNGNMTDKNLLEKIRILEDELK